MNAAGYCHAAHMAMPTDIARWKDAMPGVLAKYPEEHHEAILEYLRGMHKRTLVVRREAGKPESLARKAKAGAR